MAASQLSLTLPGTVSRSLTVVAMMANASLPGSPLMPSSPLSPGAGNPSVLLIEDDQGIATQLIRGLSRAIALGVVDEIVEPADTRQAIARAIAAVPASRGRHGNIPL